MPVKRPFLEDGSQFGVSRTGFRRMRQAEKRDLMIQWFHSNFEDPTNKTPRLDGEFTFIWGGPYDAREQLYSKFGDIVSEKLVEQVAEEVEAEGITDWAPVRIDNVEDWEGIDYSDELDDLSSLDHFSPDPTQAYGTEADLEARARVQAALDRVQATRDQRQPVGIGHNRPPSDEPSQLQAVRPALSELRIEFGKANPNISLITRWTKTLRDVLLTSAKWAVGKLDKGVDAAITTAAGGGVFWFGSHYSEALLNAVRAIIHWLHLVARVGS